MNETIAIALIGYGKMGVEIEKQARTLGIQISKKIDRKQDLTSTNFASNEIAIEFTAPDCCIDNIAALMDKNVPTICGTTGWHHQERRVKAMVQETNGTFLHASNFSIGVHLFWKTLNFLSKQINNFDDYRVIASETHHIHKKDTPSGTAKTCEDIVEKNISRIKKLDTESLREGEVLGDHHIYFDSPVDTIEISHKAKSRAGFALGAIKCAQWIAGKKGFFTIDDYLAEHY